MVNFFFALFTIVCLNIVSVTHPTAHFICGLFMALLVHRGFRDLMNGIQPKRSVKIIVTALAGLTFSLNAAVANAEPCVNQAWRLTAPQQMLECEMVFETPESNRKYTLAALEKAQHEICAAVPSAEMMQCFDLHYEAAKIFKERVGLLILKGYQKIADDMYPRPLSPCPSSFSKELCASVQWPQEAGTSGLVLLILFYALMGWVGRVRSVLIIVVATIGCLTASVAEGACTPEQLAFNQVGAQYGVVYPCGEKAKKPAPKIDVKGSVRAYFESLGKTQRVDENPNRLNRIATAFEAVYDNEPIEVQKLALAICLKETGCGFSEAWSYKIRGGKAVKSHRIYTREVYMSKVEACGIVQVATRDLKGECARLNASFEYAFRSQLHWLKTYWNQGIEDSKGRLPKVDLYDVSSWQKEVRRKDDKGKVKTYYAYRYNGGGRKAWAYGRKVMQIYKMMKNK